MTQRARLIANPSARTLPSRDRLQVATHWLRLHGWTTDSFVSRDPKEATTLARQAAEDGYDVVIAAGGDGMVNNVVNGLAGSGTALAVVPGGTANVWTRESHSPAHPGDVAAMIARGRRVRIDLGLAGERYFLLMASLGLDSIVTQSVHGVAKARFGRGAYIAAGLREAVHYGGVQATITADGQTRRMPLMLALLGNTRSYGGLIQVSHHASATDGVLDLVAFRAGGPVRFAADLARTALRRHTGWQGAVYERVTEAWIETDPAVPVQADGEIVGETPMRFSVRPLALDVIVPASRSVAALDAAGGRP
jgi:diacylglycerol kinase (ATP)